MPTNNPWSFSLGRVLGIQLEVHVTFAVLLGWIALRAFDAGGGWKAVVSAVLLMVAAFFTIFLHELGHALVARRFGVRTLDIQLTPMGGMSHLERVPENPRHELLIALTNPIINLIITTI